ncbi:MAG: Crp/Fnr family transcriptional regulator [Cyanothece sp. SIO1E1]|nr:Crp/Fnr family transcriptional regulator [Cyanothece sp. SIO1E1]
MPLTEDEAEQLLSIVRTARVKKRQYVVQPGFVCRDRIYIVEGAFRVFYLDQDGKEHTVSIGIEDWFVSDFYSYITQTPATHYAEALEDSIILQMGYNDIEALCGQVHSLSEYFRRSTERAFAFSRRRVISNISKSAEERYFDYVEQYPQIVNRVPQYVLASYLGISAEFLSKIRSRKSRKS